VLENGPFVFENGQCLFIDVALFQWEDWQWPRIPVMNVTDLAQDAFLTEFDREPRVYLKKWISENWSTGLFYAAFLGVLTIIQFLWRRE